MRSLLFTALWLSAGCQSGTWVVLDLDGELTVPRIEMAMTLDGKRVTHALGATRLPSSVAVELPHGGSFHIDATAYGTDDSIVATASGDQMIGASHTVHLRLQLGAAAPSGGDGGPSSSGLLPSTDTIQFGNVATAVGSQPVSFDVTNSGNAATGTLHTTLSGDGFKLVMDTCDGGPLPALARCTVTIQLSSNQAGSFSGTVMVTASPGGTAQVRLAGQTVATQTLTIDPASKAYGDVALGANGPPTTMTVTNIGNATTAPLQAVLSGPNAGAFQIVTEGCIGMMLATNQQCSLDVRFAPSGTHGAQAASLVVSDGSGAIAIAALGGNAVAAAALRLDAKAGSDFGPLVVGSAPVKRSFTVFNSGDQPTAKLSASLSASGDFSIESDLCSGQPLQPGSSCGLTVSFAPGSVGAKNVTLTVSADTLSAARVLTGAGVLPGMATVSPTAQDYSTVLIGATADVPFTVSNMSSQPTPAISAALDGSAFSIQQNGCSGTLAPMANCTVTVRFAPIAVGPATGTLHLGGSDVPLSGVGAEDVRLTVTRTGNGAGNVTASSSGSLAGPIDCGSTCAATYRVTALDQPVTFTAQPGLGSEIGGWSVAACGVASTCTVPVEQARALSVTFNLQRLTIDVSITAVAGGTGQVKLPDGTLCSSGTCHYIADYGSVVALDAEPTGAFYFGGWSGACAGFQNTCAPTLTHGLQVTASFTPANKMFVTGQTYAGGSIGGLAGADAICATRASAAKLSGHFVAFLTTSTVDARTRIAGARGWLRFDGKPLLDAPTDNKLFYPASIDDTGEDAGGSPVWIGENTTWNGVQQMCGDWTSSSGQGAHAMTSDASLGVSAVGDPCSGIERIYCFQVDYQAKMTVPSTPGRFQFLHKGMDASKGIAAFDASCQSDATAAKLPGTYHALVAGVGTTAASRFNSSGLVWKRTDDVVLAASAADFLQGNITAPPALYADGTFGYSAWVGALTLQTAGTAATTCNNWMTNDAASVGYTEYTQRSGFNPANNSSCNSTFFDLICLQD
jgi:hypothetical protein